MLKPPRLLPAAGDDPTTKAAKNLKLFEHMCLTSKRKADPPKIIRNWKAELELGLDIKDEQRSIIDPTQMDMSVGHLLREVALGSGVKKMAARRLNTFGEQNHKCNMLNHPDRMTRVESSLQLGQAVGSLGAAGKEMTADRAKEENRRGIEEEATRRPF